MVEPTTQPDGLDPLQLRVELESALHQEELAPLEDEGGVVTREVEQAACGLAIALGRCRLFGVELPEDLDGTMPRATAEAATAGLVDQLRRATEEARVLGERWDRAEEPVEAHELVCGLLETRMDAWAATEALDEARQALLEDAPEDGNRLAPAIEQVLNAIDAFDEALEAEESLLSTAADTHLLENWRGMLAEAFREPLPWWLDGSLEAVAQRDVEAALDWLPDEAEWEALRASWSRPDVLVLPWRPAVAPQLRLAAAESRGGNPPRVRELTWRSPDDRFEAMLVFPPGMELPAVEPLVVSLARVEDDGPAVELSGKTLHLGDLSLTVDERGLAHLTLGQLPESESIPELRLGGEPAAWRRFEL